MDRLKASALAAVVGLLLLPGILAAETFWDGNAARIREGEISEPGLLAASNTFPRNTRIRVTNRASGTTQTLTVVKRIERVTNVMLLVSPEAASLLGIGSDDIVPVRIAIAGEQGIPVDTGMTESAFSPDPDVNPSAALPVVAARAPLIEPRPVETTAPVETAPPPEAEPAPTTLEPAESAPAESTPVTPEASDTTAEPVEPAVTEVAARPTPAVAEPPPVSTPPAETVVAAPPTEETPAAVEPQPPAESVTEPAIRLPETTPEEDELFVAEMIERTPEKRVFAPPRGADVAELFLAEEAPWVSPDAEIPATDIALAPEVLPDTPDVAPAASATTGVTAEPALTPAETPIESPVESAALPVETTPFVQTERPDRFTSPDVAAQFLSPTAPELAMLPGAHSLIEPAGPVETVVEPPVTEPEQVIAFVQVEAPRSPEVAAAGPPPVPAAPAPTEQPVTVVERGFVQTEQPRAQGAEVAQVTPPVPAAPAAPAPVAAVAQTGAPERPFVQTEQPRADAVVLAAVTPVPSAPADTTRDEGRPFVQTEQPGAAATDLAVALTAPAPPDGGPPVVAGPVTTEDRAFVQTEQPGAQEVVVALVPTTPQPPGERGPGAGFVQTEGPSPAADAVAAAGMLPDTASPFVQVEPAASPGAAALALETVEPAVPDRSVAVAGAGMVQTEQPNPAITELALETTTPRSETATEIMSMVDSPTGQIGGTTLADASLPPAPDLGVATSEGARIPRIGDLGGEAELASLGSVQTSAGPPVTDGQATVQLTVTTAEPPPDGTGGAAVVGPTGSQGTQVAAAHPAAGTPAAGSPAALLSAAVTRKGLPVNAYYLQVAAVASEKIAQDLVARLQPAYPSWVIPPDAADRSVFRVLVGPLTEDERGAVLSQFKASGYRDAYIRYLN